MDNNLNPGWVQNLDETKKRWFVFLEKLERKMEELCAEAIPELKEVFANDEDTGKRTFNKVFSGVKGQLENIHRKAYDTYEEKILGEYYALDRIISPLDAGYRYLNNFRNECSERYHNDFDKKLSFWQNQLDATKERDLEVEYQKVLQEYESIKHKFTCKQCGATLTIDKIFFIDVYITCPACRTQNTFQPSSAARMVQHFSRDLAHQRTASLYEAFAIENGKERKYYHQIHDLKLKNTFTPNDNVKQQIEQLEKERLASIENAPKLHAVYLRALYDEMNKITPDLKEHNEIMYENEMKRI